MSQPPATRTIREQLASLLPECGRCASFVSAHNLAEAFGNAVDAKDPHTANHSRVVAALAELLARAMGLTALQVERVHLAAHVHDIGKIGIPEAILGKAGPLNPAEWPLMRRHPDIGAGILRPCFPAGPGSVRDMVVAHHERFDGGGYPCGLAGRDIPLGARIIAVVDSFSAMRQDRPYRQGMGHGPALEEVARCRGGQFDPDVAGEFLRQEAPVRELMEGLARTAPTVHLRAGCADAA